MEKLVIEILKEEDIRPSLMLEPAAGISRPIEFFEDLLQTKAIDDCDDLEEFKMLLLKSSTSVVFGLWQYKHQPKGEVTLHLPLTAENSDDVISGILDDLQLPHDALLYWQKDKWEDFRLSLLDWARKNNRLPPR